MFLCNRTKKGIIKVASYFFKILRMYYSNKNRGMVFLKEEIKRMIDLIGDRELLEIIYLYLRKKTKNK